MSDFHIDLHMHSTASDGTLTPRGLARACKEAGLEYCALTDHDTIDGVSDFLDEAGLLGLHALAGIEFSARYEGELHILGYGIDVNSAVLTERLKFLAKTREERVSRMVDKLIKAGYDITLERVRAIAGEGVVGRPHIAAALVEKGYCADVPDAFSRLLSRGGAGYIERHCIESTEAISLIKSAGGIPVFAHPGITADPDTPSLVERLVSEGIEGIEVYYPTHSDEEISAYLALAKEHGLYVTCGSDFHGTNRRTASLGCEKRGNADMKKSVIQIFDIFRHFH